MKKIRLIVFAAAFAALFTGTVFASRKQKQKVVRIGYQTGGLCAAPVHIAMANNLFEEEFSKIGQKVEYVHIVEGGSPAGELIASGKIDACYGLLATQLQPMENGLPIVFTTGIHTGCTKYYVKKDSPIKSVADLRGKKIGIPGLADSSVMNIKRKLDDYGIGITEKNNEVEFIVYASSDLPIALDKGAVDVIGLHDPVAQKGEDAYGFRKILDTGLDEKFKDEYCCQAYVTKQLLKTNPEGAAAYTRAMQKASAFVKEDPREAARIQLENKYVSGDLDFNAKLLASYEFKPSRTLGRATFISAGTQLQKIGLIKATTDINAFLKAGYVDVPGVPEGYTYNKTTKTYSVIPERN